MTLDALQSLTASTQTHVPLLRPVSTLRLSVNPQHHQLTVSATVRGTKSYYCTIEFLNILLSARQSIRTPLSAPGKRGSGLWMEIPTTRRHQVRVWCSCPHFIYTYAHGLRENDTLAGSHILPPRHLNHRLLSGICKHLLSVTENLVRQNTLYTT